MDDLGNPLVPEDFPAEHPTAEAPMEGEPDALAEETGGVVQSRLLTGRVYPGNTLRPGFPPPYARPLSRRSGSKTALWIISLMLVIASGIAAVVFLPDLMAWRKQREMEQLAAAHNAAATAHLRAERFDEAENSARETLKLLPADANAKKIIDSAGILRERFLKRKETANAALAAAAALATADDIPGAIAAYSAIQKHSPHPKEAIEQAGRELESLRAATATLVLPDDWPEYTVLSIDGKPQPVGLHQITGIPLGPHTLTVTRAGFRDPPPVSIDFKGTRPVNMPAIAWKPVGGKVNLTSKPTGAAVWFNGKDTGRKTPCSFEDVDAGKVSYQLKLAGHLDTGIEGQLASAGTLNLTANLPDLPRFPKEGKQAGERQEFNISPTLRLAFRWCPAGSFTMGGTDPAATPAEQPARTVRLSKGFWMAETEFTQGQWENLTSISLATMVPADAKAIGKGPDHPVYFVSWDQICGNRSRSGGILGKINDFMAKNGGAGWIADLPTEAQWEYACRAGTTGAFGTREAGPAAFERSAWFASNSKRHTHPVGTREANPWGLKDMHGNVLEWCRDWYQENYAKLPTTDPTGPASGWKIVVRGGSCQSSAAFCRSAARAQAYQTTSSALVGFRLLMRPPESPAPPPNAAKPAPPKKPAAKPQPKPKPKPKPKPAKK
jgi:formylglycine-generating enzyme required for sulfatase activity